MLVSAGKGLAFQRRSGNGSASSHTATSGSGAPYYVKLVRSGNTFDAYRSSDGSSWSHVGSEWIAMGSTIYVGVAVTSHNDGAVATGTFSNVSIAEGTTEAAPAPAPVAPAPAPAPSSGSELRVLHWNTQHLRGADGVFDPYRTAYWIARANADIISLNEIDDEWMASVITDAVRYQTGVHWNAAFSGWGNLILTKLPLNNSSVCHFNPGAGRKAAHLSTQFNGRTINLWSAHLATDSSGTRSYEIWNLQNCAWSWGEAQLIAGDFNMQPYSPEYNVMTSAFGDGWAIAKSNGATANYSGNCDGCTRNSRIDYIFSSWSWFLSVKYAEVYDTRDGWGTMASDHKPLIVVYGVQ
jgi:endonuclease/exonuclease/phosphatase family metal-dependent hydrolase